MDEPELAVVDAGCDAATDALEQYFAELDARFPGGFDPGDAIAEARTDLNPPRGVFVLAERDGRPLACGGVVHLDDDTSEIKRMWVSPDARGRGLGRRLLARLEDEARAAGRRTVVLDTNGSLLEAIAMYEAAGYTATERYNDNPYAQRWFVKQV